MQPQEPKSSKRDATGGSCTHRLTGRQTSGIQRTDVHAGAICIDLSPHPWTPMISLPKPKTNGVFGSGVTFCACRLVTHKAPCFVTCLCSSYATFGVEIIQRNEYSPNLKMKYRSIHLWVWTYFRHISLKYSPNLKMNIDLFVYECWNKKKTYTMRVLWEMRWR